MVIDFHIHYCPEKFVKPNLGPGGTTKTLFSADGKAGDCALSLRYDLPKFIEMMDHGGIDIAVLTSGAGMRRDLSDCRFINDEMRKAEEGYKGRFKGVAHVPPLGGRDSFAELERCKNDLGFKGACMHSVVRGINLDDPTLYPFYEKISELDMFLIIHPGSAEYSPFLDYDLGRSVGREGHLAAATVSLIEGGILDRFPNLKIVMSHLGGHFYTCISRIELYQDKVFWGTQDHPRHSRKSKMPFRYYLNKMYFDLGGIQGDINPVKMALMEISPKNLLYGTDYPLEIREGETIKKFVDKIKGLPLSQEDVDAILGGNAKKLLGI
jgi:predicted TIM-barrel fold metal-dependent hydrolase